MRVLIGIMVFVCATIGTQAHGLNMAVFKIYASDMSIDISVTFDLDNFNQAIGEKEANLQLVQSYLDENTHFQFDQKVAILTITEFDMTNDVIQIKGTFGMLPFPIERITIKNTCLSNIPKHSNLIKLELNNGYRAFRMHKARTTISVKY